MKATYKGLFRVFLCALVLTFVAASASATVRPFKMKGSTALTLAGVDGDDLVYSMDGAGTGTHVGNWTNTGSFVLEPTGHGTGEIDLVAANGDHLIFEADGHANLSTGNVVATYAITGGTGRFDGATGDGVMLGKLAFTSFPTASVITYTISGNIDY